MSIEACAELVRQADPDRFMSVIAAPSDKRAGLFSVFAFNVEVSRAPWVSDEPLIGKMRLQWWRDALDEFSANAPVRKHEVTDALAIVGSDHLWPVLKNIVSAREWDTEPRAFEDWDELRTYARGTSGYLLQAAGIATGVTDRSDALLEFGTSVGVANLLRAVPEMKRRQVEVLPSLSDADLVQLISLERQLLSKAKRKLSRDSYPAARSGWQSDKFLSLVAANPAVLLTDGLHIPDFSKRFSLLWRAFLNRP